MDHPKSCVAHVAKMELVLRDKSVEELGLHLSVFKPAQILVSVKVIWLVSMVVAFQIVACVTHVRRLVTIKHHTVLKMKCVVLNAVQPHPVMMGYVVI